MADTKLYDLLGTPPNASETEIENADRKLVVKFDPDKKPTEDEKFEETSFVYDVLSEKRDVYDHEGIKECTAEMSDEQIAWLFRKLYCHRKTKCEDTIYHLKVTLEDLYTGIIVKVNLRKEVICKACDGIGGILVAIIRCTACDGSGTIVSDVSVEPCVVQHMQSVCSDCSGTGKVMYERYKCTVCKGKNVRRVTKRISVHIARGMQNGQKLCLKGQGNQQPGLEPGDLILILQQLDHETFVRKGADLYMNYTLTLTEALCGFHMLIKQLDGRDLLVYTVLGKVIKPGSVKRIIFKGMPVYKHRFERGDLYVKFHVTFPENNFADVERITCYHTW